ncbi:fructokinase [Pseudoalteromonas sp. GCY]|uniref:carbohydrate kinase family protein n=1 Tax=Pseudoalteromonas sp. GCY TaxID=2003316 RepID=UPI000BFF0DBC|nr:carbohydrate kinase [Pseudoalteromonas sp. GCY]PHI37903.1 fructokinase [Pseudoalteromonas sp. GCY]QQQ65028.1 carbohydrate kinase [Pseudoalteromonas sp. GCY]
MALVCFGEALIDFLSDGKTPESFTKYAGGAPANVAVAAAKQGVDAYFCGMLGNDMFGQFLAEELQANGVNTRYLEYTDKAKTALAFVSLDKQGERSFSFYRPPAADLLFRQTHFSEDMFTEHSVLHICSNSLTEENIYKTTVCALERARANNMLVSFDMNLRLNLWSSTAHILDRIWHCIALSDVVKLSREELEYLNKNSHAGKTEAQTIAAIMDKQTQLLLITDGANPVEIYLSCDSAKVAAPNVVAVDTTAAGDAFVGGLLAEIIRKFKPTRDAEFDIALDDARDLVAYAAKCGAFAVQRYGAFASLPSKGDIGE